MAVKVDLRGGSAQGNVALWKLWSWQYEEAWKKSGTGTAKQPSIDNNCGQLIKSWCDCGHDDSGMLRTASYETRGCGAEKHHWT